jgi:hypothetical protein
MQQLHKLLLDVYVQLSVFWASSAHHQELNSCSSSFWFYRWSSAVGRGQAGKPDHDQQHCYHHAPKVKSEAATAVVDLLVMG